LLIEVDIYSDFTQLFKIYSDTAMNDSMKAEERHINSMFFTDMIFNQNQLSSILEPNMNLLWYQPEIQHIFIQSRMGIASLFYVSLKACFPIRILSSRSSINLDTRANLGAEYLPSI